MTIEPPPHEVPGFAFPPLATAVSTERQAEYHDALGIASELFGRFADPHILGNDCLLGARPRRALGRERLHMGIRLRQADRLRLDEPLDMTGVVVSCDPHRLGELIRIDFSFLRPDGSAPIVIEHRSLMLEGKVDKPKDEQTQASLKPKPDLSDYVELARYTLTPDDVRDYSEPFRHFHIHHEESEAQRVGLRTGIAQGLHMFGYVMAELYRPDPPLQLDVDARFLGSVFWDETVRVMGKSPAGDFSEIRIVNPAGAVVTSATILEISR